MTLRTPRFQTAQIIASALAVATTMLLAGCSGSSDGAGPDSPSASPATNDPAALLDQALKEQAQGKTAAAKADYERLLTLDPRNKFAYYNLGVIAQQSGDETTAATNYTRTLQVDPNYNPALFNLAIITSKQGRRDQAVLLYRRAIKSNPRDAGSHFNLGLLLQEMGQRQQGLNEINLAIKIDPKYKSRLPKS